MKIKGWIFAIVVFLPIFLISQNSQNGNWLIYFGNQKLDQKWNWHNEIQYRNHNFIGDLQQFVVRTGFGYNLSDNNNTILLGYGYFHFQNYILDLVNKVATNEHRIFQQFVTKQNFSSVYIQHRYRIEERIFNNDFQIRFRYFLGVNVPINKKLMMPKTFYASVYNELFLNNQNQFFDRNRLYVALGYVINKNLKMEIGYMNQATEKINRNQFQIVFFNNLPIN